MRPTSEQDYRDTLALIHEAALDVAAWLPVLRRLAALTGCIAGGLTAEDPSTGRGRPITYFGFDPDRVEREFDHFLPMNPLFSIAPRMQPGFVVANGDVIALQQFRKTAFYNGWARPQALCSPISLVLHRDGQMFVPLTLVRPDGAGEASDDDRALLSDLAPHLMQALRTNLRLHLLETRQQMLGDAVDRLAVGILVLDSQRRVTYLNPAAEAALNGTRGLCTSAGVLAASDPAFDGVLQKAIARALASESPANTDLVMQDTTPSTVSVIALRREGVPAWAIGLEGACLVLVSNPATLMAAGLEKIAQAFRLTRTETRLLGAILGGGGLAKAADQLGVVRHTAKTHLHNIFAKTGTRRQAELIQLVLGTTPSLAPKS